MTHVSEIPLLGLFITLFIGFALPAQANKNTYPIGELIALEGKAYYIGESSKAPLGIGDPIYFNSTIETGKDAKALILFIDDTEITLAEETVMTMDEYVFDPYDPRENKADFNFLKGAFLWTSGMVADKDPPDVRLDTARGSIGIRGTTVWGGETAGGYGVFVAEGAVNFTGDWGGVDIPGGKGFILSDTNLAQDIKEPNNWKKPVLDAALKTVTFSSPLVQKQAEQRLAAKKKENIARRHDYRGHMFPYKENPFRKRLKGEDDKFFSDEFEEMRNK
jgi:hypothetical protein